MALLSINSNTTHGFSVSVEVDRILFSYKRIFVTETKTVDGMPDVKWYIKVYPEVPSSKANFGIYACIESEREIEYKINGKFISSVTLNNDDAYHFDYVYGTHSSGKMERCIKEENINLCLNDQKNYFTNGKLKFQVDASFSYTKESKSVPRICCPSAWGLRLQENSDEDFKIVVGGETFRVHKFIITAESPLFKQMFEDDFKEAREGKVAIIDFEPQTVKAFIDYCYGQSVTTESDTEKINLLYFSDKYDCQTLKPQLESHLASKISKEKLSLYVLTADKANALHLRQACVRFVRHLLNINVTIMAGEIASFDAKFMMDVITFNGGI